MAIAAATAVLVIPAVATAGTNFVPDSGTGSPALYVVQPNDGLVAIAEDLGVDVEDLLATNGLTIDSIIHPGQFLVIPGPGGPNGPATRRPPAPAPASQAAADESDAEATPDLESNDAPAPAPAPAPSPTSPAPAATTPASSAPAPASTNPPAPAPTSPPPTDPPAPPPTDPPAPQTRTGECLVGGIAWINNARAQAGVPPISQAGAGSACQQSRNQAQQGSMFHAGGPCGWEIVGYASNGWNPLPGAWLNSPSHYNIVVSPQISSGSVAYVQNLETGFWYGTGHFC